jgi:hypothetical protein
MNGGTKTEVRVQTASKAQQIEEEEEAEDHYKPRL